MSRRVVAGLGLICIVIVSILIALLVQSRPAPEPSPTSTSSASPTVAVTEQGMLVAVRDDAGAIGDAIVIRSDLEAGGAATASMLAIQPGLGLGFIPSGTATLAEFGPQPPQMTQALVGGQLGVSIPNGLIMDRLAFAALVDAVGGVVVDNPNPIYGRKSGGKRVLLFPAGQIRLYGPAAASYALHLGPKENQSDRMARFDQVWMRVVAGLPQDEQRMRSILTSLGSSARSSTAVGVMATILVNYQRAQAAQAVLAGSLPARATGVGPSAVFTPDPVATTAVSTRLFSGTLLTPGAEGVRPRIRLVDSGANNAALVRATDQLAKAGFDVVWGGDAAPTKASVVYLAASGTAQTVDAQIAAAVGIPASGARTDATLAAGVTATLEAATDLFSVTPSPTPSVVASTGAVVWSRSWAGS